MKPEDTRRRDVESAAQTALRAQGLIALRPMDEQQADLRSAYQELSDARLLELNADSDSLTPVARMTLASEIAGRGLDAPDAERQVETAERELVTLRSYRDLSEAIVARSLLESAGITVYLQNENLVRLDWQVSNFIGGIRLQVDRGEAQAAEEILSQPVPDTIEFGRDEEFSQPHCPACGSIDIMFEGASRTAAVTSLWVLGLPMPTGDKTGLCDACGARWEETED